jgi:hypothetical protein
MINPVSGFRTEDGNFFENKEEAVLHEAILRLAVAALDMGVDPDKLMRTIDACDKEIEHYITARRAARPTSIAAAHLGEQFYERTTEEVASELEQSFGGDGAVSDVGDGELAETVADTGKVDGSGSRRIDARSVWGSEDLAIDPYPGLTPTRTGDGEPSVRSEAVAAVPKDV